METFTATASCDNEEITAALVQALRRPGVLDPDGAVELIETHISYVLLTQEFTYKIKKPVNLGFVDFSTLKKREYFCREELRLNKRLADELYISVVTITDSIKHPELNGSGPVLEFAVKMKKFPSEAELRNLIHKGTIPIAYFEHFASELARFHRHADPASPDSRFSCNEALAERAMDNFKDIQAAAHQPDIKQRVTSLKQWTLKSLKSNAAKFTNRKINLRIRECHGDLHLSNLVLIDNRIVPFDCLEFNEDFRWIDVASELAFLFMDLCAHKFNQQARRVLNRYLEVSGDYEIVPLLRHYLVYRAMVSAKISCMHPQQASKKTLLNPGLLEYIDLAERFANSRQEKLLIITYGFSGCGKTWVTDQLIERTDLIRIRSDIIRKQIHHIDIATPSNSLLESGIYTKDATHRTYETLARIAATTLDADYPVVVDATFLKKKYRDMFRDIAYKHKAQFRILHLDAPNWLLRSRIIERHRKQNDISEADLSVLKNQTRNAEPLEPVEIKDVLKIETNKWTNKTLEFTLEKLRLTNVTIQPAA